MSKIGRIICSIILPLASYANAANDLSFEVNGLSFIVTSEEGHEVAVSSATSTDTGVYDIPAKVTYESSDYTVTAINYGAFLWCKGLQSVTIPNTVKLIGDYAFSGAVELTSLSIGNSVTEIGESAFANCCNLKTIELPNSLKIIGVNAFSNCTNISTLSLGSSIVSINDGAFIGCRNIPSIVLPPTLVEIGEWAFSNCESLTSVTLPKSLISIGENAFNGCSNLESINVDDDNNFYSSIDGVLFNSPKTTIIFCPEAKYGEYSIPTSVTTIGARAFRGCKNLSSICIPNSVTQIDEEAFAWCPKLSVITIPNSVLYLDDSVFYYCENLSTAIIGDTVEDIGNGTFAGCQNLSFVIIGKSVSSIDTSAFYDCNKIWKIIVRNPIPPNLNEGAFLYTNPSALIFVPKGCSQYYLSNNGWDYFSYFYEMGNLEVCISEQSIDLEIGESIEIHAIITKDDDVTIKSTYWYSSNPENADVDNCGKITAKSEGKAEIICTIIDCYDQIHSVSCLVSISSSSNIINVQSDAISSVNFDFPYDVFDISGRFVGCSVDNLSKGIYIIRQDRKKIKFRVK